MSEEVESVYSSFNGFLKKKKSVVKTEPQKNDKGEDINVNADALVEGKEEEGEEVKNFFNQNVGNNDEEETPPESKEIPEEKKEESEEESEADKELSEDDEEKESENDSQSSEGGEENEGEPHEEESQESPVTQRIEDYLSNNDDEDDDDDDDEYLSPEEEKLYYSSDENSVSFDDLNNNKEEDEDDDEDDDAPPPKMDISQLTGSKKKFMSGKPKKGLILGVLGGIFALLFLTLEAKKIVSERKEAQEASKKVQTINTGEYSPDFGDYEARAYKPTAIDQAASEANYTEALLNSGEKRPFEEETAVNKGNTSPSYQPSSSSQSGGGGSSSWNDAMTSPIRYQGFNGSTGSQGILDTLAQGQGSYYPSGYSASYNPVTGYAQGYGEILDSLTGQNGNQGQVSQNNRQFTAGQGSGTNQASYQQIPENSIYPGTIIHAVMVSGINTDYPAPITARVIENVYDSKTGKKLLIPSGSILRGSYSSASLGVNRVEIAWTELVINRDGKDWLVNLGNMAGVDRSGYSGIKGTLNEHAFAYVKAMGWASLFTYMNSNIYTYTKAQKSQTQRQMIEDSQDIANRLTDRILDRALDIEPTIRVKPGTKVSVAVDRVVTLNPYSQDVPIKKYVRK